MGFIGIIGFLLVFFGVLRLRTFIQRKRWPVVQGTLDSVDLKIEPSAPTEVVGFFFEAKYIHKIQYSYRDRSYIVEISKNEITDESLKLKVNPEKPYEAYLDNTTMIFPALAIIIGIILILVSINVGVDENY